MQDVLVHIQDASHPDRENQIITVNETLQMLDIDSTKPIIEVANKRDKLSLDEIEASPCLCISAKDGTGVKCDIFLTKIFVLIPLLGLMDLTELIQSKLIEVTNRRLLRLLVQSGGVEYR